MMNIVTHLGPSKMPVESRPVSMNCAESSSGGGCHRRTGIRESFASRHTTVPYQSIPGNNGCRAYYRRMKMSKAARLLMEDSFRSAVGLLQYGADNGGIFIGEAECKVLCDRLRTSVDLGPLVETLAELVNQTLVTWRGEEKGKKT